MDIRPTTAEDLPALHDVFGAAMGELYGRHALRAPGAPLEVFRLQHEHVLAHDADRCRVGVERGRPVGFAAAIVRSESWFLSSLFVRPDSQGRGLGTALLDCVWDGEFTHRRTLTDAIQPVSNGLYARRGLTPVTPALHLGGRPSAEASLKPGNANADDLRRLDVAAYGFDRAVDHAYWSRHGRRTAWLRDGEVVAYAYVFPGGRVGPLAGVTARDAEAALRSELAGMDEASLVVPGTCRELVAAALDAGLRIVRVPGLLLLSHGTAAPTSLVISGYTLL